MRGVHCVRPPAQPEGIDAPAHRLTHLRRLLGVLLVIHLQYKCDGEGGHATRRESRRDRRTQAESQRHRAGAAEAQPPGQIGLSEHAQLGSLLHAGPRRHRHARPAAVLRAALRLVQKVPECDGRGWRSAAQELARLEADVLSLFLIRVSWEGQRRHLY